MTQTPDAPRRGDVVWVSFSPQVGREQAGRRPALVLSSTAYNRRVGLTVVCPTANQQRGYPFEVAVPDGLAVSGVILADQIRSIDWRGRNTEFLCAMPADVVAEVLERTVALLET